VGDLSDWALPVEPFLYRYLSESNSLTHERAAAELDRRDCEVKERTREISNIRLYLATVHNEEGRSKRPPHPMFLVEYSSTLHTIHHPRGVTASVLENPLTALRESLGLSRHHLATVLQVSYSSLWQHEAGYVAHVSPAIKFGLSQMGHDPDHLARLYDEWRSHQKNAVRQGVT
jgi:hypothetical protein